MKTRNPCPEINIPSTDKQNPEILWEKEVAKKKRKRKKELSELYQNEIIISMQQSKTIYPHKIHVKI